MELTSENIIHRNSLREKSVNLESSISLTETELKSFVRRTEEELIRSQVNIPRLQRELVEKKAGRAGLTRSLGNIRELKLEKQ